MMSVEVEAPGSREAESSRAGCSSGWSNGSTPLWPAHIHPGLINTVLTQLLCSPGRRGNAFCLCEGGGKGAVVQRQIGRGSDCQDQRTALIYLPFLLHRASKLQAFHCELSLVCSASSCGIPNISFC